MSDELTFRWMLCKVKITAHASTALLDLIYDGVYVRLLSRLLNLISKLDLDL